MGVNWVRYFFSEIAVSGIVQHIRKVNFHLFQMDLSAFNAAHIQHIVDEGEQMVAGCKGLAKIILHLFTSEHNFFISSIIFHHLWILFH